MSTHPLQGLKTIRERLEIKVKDLADHIGKTVTTYYRYEAGTRPVYLHQAIAIADMLGVTVDNLRREPTVDEQIELIRRAAERKEKKVAAEADPWTTLEQEIQGAPEPAPAPPPPSPPTTPGPDDPAVQAMLTEWDDPEADDDESVGSTLD